MILYIENLKDSAKTVETTNISVKLQDTRLTYKNWLYFFTLTMIRYRNLSNHYNSIKRIKYLSKFNQGSRDLCLENYKTLSKKMKIDTNGSIYCVMDWKN